MSADVHVEYCRARGVLRRVPSSAIAATPLEKIPTGPAQEAARLTSAGQVALELWLLEPVVGHALKRQGLQASDIINAFARLSEAAACTVEIRYAKQLLAQVAWEVELCAAGGPTQFEDGEYSPRGEDSSGLDATVPHPTHGPATQRVALASQAATTAVAPTPAATNILHEDAAVTKECIKQAAVEPPHAEETRGRESASMVGEMLLGMHPHPADNVVMNAVPIAERTAPREPPSRRPQGCVSPRVRRRQTSLERAHHIRKAQHEHAMMKWEKKEKAIEDFEEQRAQRIEDVRSKIRDKSRQKEQQVAAFLEAERQRKEERQLELERHQQQLHQQAAKTELRYQQVQELMGTAAATRKAVLEDNRLRLWQAEQERLVWKNEKLTKAIAEAEARRQETLRMRSAGPPPMRAARELARRQAARVEKIREAERDLIKEAYEAKVRQFESRQAFKGSRPPSAQGSRPASAGVSRMRARPALVAESSGLEHEVELHHVVDVQPCNTRVHVDKEKVVVDGQQAAEGEKEQEEPEAECTLVSAPREESPCPAVPLNVRQILENRIAPEPQAVPWPGVFNASNELVSAISSISSRHGRPGAAKPPQQQHAGACREDSKLGPSRPTSSGSRSGSAHGSRPHRPISAGSCSDQTSTTRSGSSSRCTRGAVLPSAASSDVGRMSFWDDVLEDFVGLPHRDMSEEQLLQELDRRTLYEASLSFAGLFAWAQSESGSSGTTPQEYHPAARVRR
mmetsp:Transcript_49462/g.115661  ORF Transcript_49462/g.115661 Transcript_49462/m.115661 type:complete len:740 (-) Transcript_49462:40-2259(-)